MRKLFIPILILMIGFVLAAAGCQATAKKQVDAPLHWTNTLSRKGEKIKIEADVDLTIPTIGNTPVQEFKRAEFGNSELKKMVDYFTRENRIYERQPPLRAEVEQKLEEMKQRKGMWGHPWYMYYVSSWLGNASEKVKEAPKSNGVRNYVKPEFGTQYAWEPGWYTNEASEKEVFYFDVMVDVNEEHEPEIIAMSYNEKAGSNPMFSYRIGTAFSKSENQEWRVNLNQFETNKDSTEEWRTSYSQYLDNMERVMQEAEMQVPEKEAEAEAKKVLSELEIKGLEEISFEPCAWIPDTLSDINNAMTADWSAAKAGFKIVYGRTCGELKGYQQPRGVAAIKEITDMPEKVYGAPFFQETITMVITEEGLQEFTWDNMADISKVVAENPNLKPFDEIQDRLADHMLNMGIAIDEANGFEFDSNSSRYVITDVELRATYINAANEPQRAWLVPAWIFRMDWYLKKNTNGGKELLREPQIVMINAIDGGYIAIAGEEK